MVCRRGYRFVVRWCRRAGAKSQILTCRGYPAATVQWQELMRLILVPVLLSIVAGVSVAQETESPLAILTGRTLPKAILTSHYEVKLEAKGGVAPRSWELVDGHLPPGLTLDDSGLISGTPSALGQFRFVLEVSDSDDPPDTRDREFVLNVLSALAVEWKNAPAVTQGGINGSLKLANQTADDVDLTMIVVAVNEVSKAFVLGYQHFILAAGTTVPEIAFGSGLPRGDYIVHADVIGEVPEKSSIYRTRLQTAEPLSTP
jgi:Putative Ig domain